MANPIGPKPAPQPGFFQGLGAAVGQAVDRTASAAGATGRFFRDGGVLGHTNVTPANNGITITASQQPNSYGQAVGALNRVLFPASNLLDHVK
jgi:hypothetical protein